MGRRIRAGRKKATWNNWFSERKLQQKMQIIFVAIIIVFAGLILSLYQFVIRMNLKQYALQNNKDTMMSIGSSVQAKINSTNTLSKQIMIDSVIKAYLNAQNGQDILLVAQANRAIDEFFSITEEIESIYVFRLDGNYIKIGNETIYFEADNFWRQELQEAIWARRGGYMIFYNGKGAFRGKKETNVLTFYRLINDVDTQKPIGILAINMNKDILYDCIKDFSNDIKGFCFMDEEGEVLLEKNWGNKEYQLELGDVSYGQEGKNRIFSEEVFSYYRIPKTGLILLSYETIGLLSMVTKELSVSILVIVCFVLAVFLLLNYTMRRYVTRPLEKLVTSMGEVKQGRFHRVSIRLPDDEIGQLKDSYNQMMVELNRLVEELIDKEKVIQKAELDILQEQIKPHFLYNTIDMIANLALEAGAEPVFEALETLGDFYRRFLSKGSKEVTILEEIDIVRDYLRLQKLRYGDIFDDVYEIDKTLVGVTVPKLILQPLVENSLYHGIRMKGEKGLIRISVEKADGMVCISVYDDGVGMRPETIKDILDSREFRSFGVKGTIERIKYYYRQNCEVTIRSEIYRYTEVVIKLPGNGGSRSRFPENECNALSQQVGIKAAQEWSRD